MKRIILLTVCCIATLNLHAQRTTNEQPYGLSSGFRAQSQEPVVLPIRDIEIIMKEDMADGPKEEKGNWPVSFAYAIYVSYTTENMGVWQQLDDGSKIWRLKVHAPGALATYTRYDKFWLPEGGKFFVYSEDTEQSIGAVISEFIEGSREKPKVFTTALIYGENVVYEYYQPASVKEPPVISISSIDYAYRYVYSPYSVGLRNFGDADTCQVNINCSEGNNWQAEKHAVARMIIPKGDKSYYCSCALVNNTNNDYTAYVLTADHCLVRNDTGIRFYDAEGSSSANPSASADASPMIFYWEYEHPGCANSSTQPTTTNRTSSGNATVVANNSVSDFALIKINGAQDPRYLSGGFIPYYLGWDRSGNPGTGGVGIHHPLGDVKKISTYDMTPWSSGNYWDFNWKRTANGFSVTEGGSSGSPLINNNHKVIGQLWGSWNFRCSNPANDEPTYGKFSVSWTGNGTTNNCRKLQPWLNPNNTVIVLDGVYAPCISNFSNQTVTTNTTITGCSTFTIQNVTISNNAKLTIISGGEVILNNNFEVSLGSQLEIY